MNDKKEQLQSIAGKLNVATHERHIFLCTGPNCCTPEQGQAAWEMLKQQIKEHNLGAVCNRTKVGCLRICCHGPTMLVYPEGTWYHGMSAEHIPEFVRRHLLEGQPVQEWIFTSHSLPEDDKVRG
jgi:(2Fe-2S) ferredoxin